MARTRVDLQPIKTIASGAATQPANEAAVVGQNRQGVVYLNVFNTQASPNVTFAIDSASDPNLSDSSTGSGNFWNQVGQTTTVNAKGVHVFTISNLGGVIRWRIPTILASEFSFSCVVFLTDV